MCMFYKQIKKTGIVCECIMLMAEAHYVYVWQRTTWRACVLKASCPARMVSALATWYSPTKCRWRRRCCVVVVMALCCSLLRRPQNSSSSRTSSRTTLFQVDYVLNYSISPLRWKRTKTARLENQQDLANSRPVLTSRTAFRPDLSSFQSSSWSVIF